MRKSEGHASIEKLIDQGWRISHEATCREYRPAGTASTMQTRNGVEYCRVHHGKCVGQYGYQITTVMYRHTIPA